MRCPMSDDVERAKALDATASTGAPVFEAINISKYFGPTTALVDVSLTARAGRIVALLGDNGAGKSTLIKILSGVFPPDRGELRFQGEPVRYASCSRSRATSSSGGSRSAASAPSSSSMSRPLTA